MYGQCPDMEWELTMSAVSAVEHKEQARKTERVEARVAPDQKALLEHASALEGRSLSEFLVSSAMKIALKTINAHERMALDVRDREVFVSALMAPPEPKPAARRAAARYKAVLGD